ncbi:MAG: dockerin type I repeat-containing protein [Candidatus Zixiibacteriota bacterium]
MGQANGYATFEYPWWNFASFQQIDTDIFLTFVQGDADGSGAIDIDDVVYLIDYIFQGGPAPQVFETGDFNGDSVIDIDDAIALLEYIFG